MIRKAAVLILVAVLFILVAAPVHATPIISPRNGHQGPTTHAVVPPGNTTYAQPSVIRTVYIGPAGFFSTSDFWIPANDGTDCELHVISRTTYELTWTGIKSHTTAMVVGKRCP